MISYTLGLIIHFYSLLILVRLLCSWIPNINWYEQPFKGLLAIVEPYLSIFRAFVPPIGTIDLSPIIALLVLTVLQKLIVGAFASVGL